MEQNVSPGRPRAPLSNRRNPHQVPRASGAFPAGPTASLGSTGPTASLGSTGSTSTLGSTGPTASLGSTDSTDLPPTGALGTRTGAGSAGSAPRHQGSSQGTSRSQSPRVPESQSLQSPRVPESPESPESQSPPRFVPPRKRATGVGRVCSGGGGRFKCRVPSTARAGYSQRPPPRRPGRGPRTALPSRAVALTPPAGTPSPASAAPAAAPARGR